MCRVPSEILRCNRSNPVSVRIGPIRKAKVYVQSLDSLDFMGLIHDTRRWYERNDKTTIIAMFIASGRNREASCPAVHVVKTVKQLQNARAQAQLEW